MVKIESFAQNRISLTPYFIKWILRNAYLPGTNREVPHKTISSTPDTRAEVLGHVLTERAGEHNRR